MRALTIPAQQMVAAIKDSKVCCFDVEHDASMSWQYEGFALHGCGFASVEDGQIINEYYTDREDIQTLLDASFDGEVECVAHNIQFDLKCLKRDGYLFDEPLCRDTMVLLNLFDENLPSYGLKDLIPSIYGHDMPDYKTASSGGLDSDEFYKYGKDDVYWELRLFLDYKPKVKRKGCWELYEVLMKSVLVFCDIMYTGMKWDIEQARQLYVTLLSRSIKVEKQIHAKIGKINISSDDQLRSRFFRDLGYASKGLSLTDSGKICLNEASMNKLAKKYPVCKLIVEYRKINKLIGTYIQPLTEEASKSFDGRVHGNYSIHSDSGRTRCSDHNLQNVPTKYTDESYPSLYGVEVRRGFVVEEGRGMIVADHSQLELRTAAHVTGDETFVNAYTKYECKICGCEGKSLELLRTCPKCGVYENEKEGFWHGLDLHTGTANNIPKLGGDRSAAKTANFAIIYNAGGFRLHEQYNKLSVDEWEDVKEDYFRKHRGVQKNIKEIEKIYHNNGAVIGLLGRRRQIPVEEKQRYWKGGLNKLINFPMQWAGSLIVQMGQIKFRNVMKKKGWWMTKAWLINEIHDELIVEADLDILDEVLIDLRDSMEKCIKLRVPLRADPKIVKCWADGK